MKSWTKMPFFFPFLTLFGFRGTFFWNSCIELRNCHALPAPFCHLPPPGPAAATHGAKPGMFGGSSPGLGHRVTMMHLIIV